MTLKIDNRDARRLWLHAQGLGPAPTGPLDVLRTIERLGYVQLDTIRNVTRAHHHILWSRNQNYREPMLNTLLADERAIFEHYTHDASVLPMDFYPMWRRQFRRMDERIGRAAYYQRGLNGIDVAAIKARIAEEGPLSTHAFDTKPAGERKMWTRPPHKLALDKLWYCGELATSHRENFKKFYDLTERVIPQDMLDQEHADEHQLDWLCRAALDRLAFATPGEIQRFWEAAAVAEVRTWTERAAPDLIEVAVETVDGSWTKALAPPDIETRLAELPPPTSRLRIINPFDPCIRDRNRLQRLFGFDYRIEIFVPAAKRLWGYYVYPLLEGDRFVGRLELKADRGAGDLTVTRFWPEPGVKWSAARIKKLDAELDRLARFVSAQTVRWSCPRPNGA